jgi:hypothetical protein
VSRGTWVADPPVYDTEGYGTLTRSGAAFQPHSPRCVDTRPCRQTRQVDSHDPDGTTAGALACHRFSLSPFRSPLLGASLLLSSRPGTEMFQFPGCPPSGYGFTRTVLRHDPERVAAFGDHRIRGCVRLPGAFRGSPRPSSALVPRASTVCRLVLDRPPVRPPAAASSSQTTDIVVLRASRSVDRDRSPLGEGINAIVVDTQSSHS